MAADELGDLEGRHAIEEPLRWIANAGQVDSVRLMRDMATGRPRGFAFVEMSSEEEAQRAVTGLNETQLGGRSLTVNEARPKPEFAGSGAGRSQGGRSRREPRW